MTTNYKVFEQIRQEMIEKVLKTKGIISIEKFLIDYLNKLDAVEIVNKYGCTLDEAIDTLESLKRTNEVKKILLALD